MCVGAARRRCRGRNPRLTHRQTANNATPSPSPRHSLRPPRKTKSPEMASESRLAGRGVGVGSQNVLRRRRDGKESQESGIPWSVVIPIFGIFGFCGAKWGCGRPVLWQTCRSGTRQALVVRCGRTSPPWPRGRPALPTHLPVVPSPAHRPPPASPTGLVGSRAPRHPLPVMPSLWPNLRNPPARTSWLPEQ